MSQFKKSAITFMITSGAAFVVGSASLIVGGSMISYDFGGVMSSILGGLLIAGSLVVMYFAGRYAELDEQYPDLEDVNEPEYAELEDDDYVIDLDKQ